MKSLATTIYPTTVYCRLTDGTNTKQGATSTITSGIDTSAPTEAAPSVSASPMNQEVKL